MRRTSQRLLLLCAPLALVVAACGGGSSSDEPDETPASATPATTAATETTAVTETTEGTGSTKPTTEDTEPDDTEPDDTEPDDTTGGTDTTESIGPSGSGEISSYEDVQPAVIQIETQGSFRDPEIGQASASGSGSGFLISPDGLAVTNNHVVTGAATLEVFIGGDRETSYNAQVLGVSECSDLALIQLDAGEELPYLDWYDGDITAGLDVYAAGYPLGDPEFTLTRGIVTKAEADGDITGSSSIDHTVEHDASTHPGNSGGPIVSAEGDVVAVHYAGLTLDSGIQKFGIASDLAQPVVDRLQDGDFEALGINGWAVVDDEQGLSGVWVAGVEPGSPAADAAILPGDIVTTMNGLPVGTDGTFRDYCDIIRTAGESNPIGVEVLRYETSEVLRGEINGDTPIELAFSFAEEVGDEVGDDTAAATATAYEYDSVTDDTGQIYVDVPTAWTVRDTAPKLLEDGTTQVPFVAASTDLEGFISGFTAPGVLFSKRPPTADVNATLAEFGFATECTDGGITDYSDPVFTGRYQIWKDCAGTQADVVTLVAVPADNSYTALIQAQILTAADVEALDRAFATFNAVIGG